MGAHRTRPDIRGTIEVRALVTRLDEPPLHYVLVRPAEMLRKRIAETQPIGRLKRAAEMDFSVICAENQYCPSITVDRLQQRPIMESYKGMSLQTLWYDKTSFTR